MGAGPWLRAWQVLKFLAPHKQTRETEMDKSQAGLEAVAMEAPS